MQEATFPVRIAAGRGFEREAAAWADRLQLPPASAAARFELMVDGEGLALRPADVATGPVKPLRADLGKVRPGSEEVVRAVRGRRPVDGVGGVVDATAGLGVDAAALARAGLRVTMIERHRVLHALLEDALARLAATGENERRELARHLALLHGDAAVLLPELDPAPEVVYLDPMYPDAGGGAKRRPMAWIRELLGEEAGGGADLVLLTAARRTAVRRVVVKRPLKAPPLAPHVSGSVRGRTTRFDLYAPLQEA